MTFCDIDIVTRQGEKHLKDDDDEEKVEARKQASQTEY